jgi:hypothetical protein
MYYTRWEINQVVYRMLLFCFKVLDRSFTKKIRVLCTLITQVSPSKINLKKLKVKSKA